MYRIMKYSLDSSTTRQLLLRSSAGSRFLCSHPQISYQSAKSPERDPINAEECPSSDFTAMGSTISPSKVTQALLELKDEPQLALEYFREIEGRQGFVKNFDLLCILLHVLMKSNRFHKMAQNLLNKAIYDGILPDSSSVVDRFFGCATKFGYELDSRVFDCLLTCYVRADKIENAIDCFDKLIENGVIPCKIATKNRLLSAMVRRDLFGRAKELYKKMKYDAVSVSIMMRGYLKLRKLKKAYGCFVQAKEREIELDQQCYEPAIYILCRRRNSKSAFELLMVMRDKKWVPHDNTYTDVIGTFVKEGNIVGALKVRDEMLSSGRRMNIVAATSLIKAYCILGDIDRAINMFENLGHLIPDVVTFSTLIQGCCKHKRVAKAREIYSQMKAMKIQPTEFTVNLLIHAYLEESSLEDGLKVLEEAVSMGIANLSTYNCVLSWLCKKGRVTEAVDLWDKMVSRGVAPSVVSYNNLILLHCKDNNMESAVETFSDMVRRGLNPDIVTLSALIEVCCKNKRVAKAHELYSQMKDMKIQPSVFNVNSLIHAYLEESSLEDGLKVLEEAANMGTANLFSYNYVLSWLRKKGRLTEAQDLWDTMVIRGMAHSVVSYNNLIMVNCRDKNMEAALETFSDMVRIGLTPDASTYSVLINACFKNGETEQALNVIDQMKLSETVPSDKIINTVINGLCKSGHSMKAKSWLENLQGFVPICRTYSRIIDGFIKEGNIEAAMSTFGEMCKNGVSPDLVTYTALIKGLCKENMDLAQKMWDQMKDNGIKPDLKLFKVLIAGYCQNRDMETALKLYSELLESGFSPNTVIYNSLMSGYQNVQNIDAALLLHSKMIKDGIPSDIVTYAILIDGLLKEDKLESTSDLYSAMISDGVKPDDVFFMVLINGLCKREQVENARRAFKEMTKSGVGPSVMMYHGLIAVYLKEGNMGEAFRLLDEMVGRGVDTTSYDVLISGHHIGERHSLPIASYP